MITLTRFAYTQVRLQARHGLRPDLQVWQQIETQKHLAGYLQSARRTSLRPWVLGFHMQDSYHVLESTLRYQLRHYIDEVAMWQPIGWRSAVKWIKHLLDLPSLFHLLSGNTAPAWMLDDVNFKPYTNTNLELRVQSLVQSEWAPIVTGWLSGQSLLNAWLQQWRLLWPATGVVSKAALNNLTTTLLHHLDEFRELEPQQAWLMREKLARKLSYMFRKYSGQPTATFIHIGLIALDVERLRAGISQRSIFIDRGVQ